MHVHTLLYVLYVRIPLIVGLTVCGWETYNLMVGKVVVNVGMQISAVDDVMSFKYSVQKPPPGPSKLKPTYIIYKNKCWMQMQF